MFADLLSNNTTLNCLDNSISGKNVSIWENGNEIKLSRASSVEMLQRERERERKRDISS